MGDCSESGGHVLYRQSGESRVFLGNVEREAPTYLFWRFASSLDTPKGSVLCLGGRTIAGNPLEHAGRPIEVPCGAASAQGNDQQKRAADMIVVSNNGGTKRVGSNTSL